MEDQKWFNSVALALAVTLIVGLLLGLGLGSSTPSKTPVASSTTVDHLYLTIAFNPSSGMDQYFPANFSVPRNAPVIITITNFDSGLNVVPAIYADVFGTTNNTMTYTDGLGGAAKTVSSVPTTVIGHTFTIASAGGGMMGGGAQPMLSVPIPAASNASHPVTVTFTATFANAGDYTWMCMAPCDPNSMVTMGLMTGTVSVS